MLLRFSGRKSECSEDVNSLRFAEREGHDVAWETEERERIRREGCANRIDVLVEWVDVRAGVPYLRRREVAGRGRWLGYHLG